LFTAGEAAACETLEDGRHRHHRALAAVVAVVAAGASWTAGGFSTPSRKGAAGVAAEVAAGAASAAFDIKSRPLTKGAAEFAAVVTGDELPVICRIPELFWAFAGGAAEGAAKVLDGKPSFFSIRSPLSARCARSAAGVALALALAAAAVPAGVALGLTLAAATTAEALAGSVCLFSMSCGMV
jgi:hypothetical protein